MAVKTKSARVLSPPKPAPNFLFRYLPAWVMLAAMLVIAPRAFNLVSQFPALLSGLFKQQTVIATLFTPEVKHWSADIERWATEYNLDPNLLATVMQIESCGHPTISSYAGAQGLFQVMPFHFTADENQLDPDTNAKRGANFLNYCLTYADGDVARAIACYNGGPSVVNKPFSVWPDQTQRYLLWGIGIYADAANHRDRSDTLDRWLAAGGGTLCQMAAQTLGI